MNGATKMSSTKTLKKELGSVLPSYNNQDSTRKTMVWKTLLFM